VTAEPDITRGTPAEPGARTGPAAVPPEPAAGTGPPPGALDRRRTVAEILIVLGLSLGASAVYAAISLVAKLTAGPPLAQQRATLNAPASPRPYLDLTYQLTGIVFALVPVALVLFLLAEPGRRARERLGLDERRPLRDLGTGAVLAALVGLPGLALYVAGRRLGITAEVVPAAFNAYWWTVPVLALQAIKNALVEEVVVVGYLMTRLRGLGAPARLTLTISAVLRGSYHLYQGFGPFAGNAVMGLVFGEWFRRRQRVMPLVIAHSLLDLVAFVGYQLLGGVSWLH
jgi:membrane protease YdiL (CAAX protease family)